MKRKTYQQPVTEVVAAAPTEMIATSMLNEAETEPIDVIENNDDPRPIYYRIRKSSASSTKVRSTTGSIVVSTAGSTDSRNILVVV